MSDIKNWFKRNTPVHPLKGKLVFKGADKDDTAIVLAPTRYGKGVEATETALDVLDKHGLRAHRYFPAASMEDPELASACLTLLGLGYIIADKDNNLVGGIGNARATKDEIAEHRRASFKLVPPVRKASGHDVSTAESRQIGNFIVSDRLFEWVREDLKAALKEVTDELVIGLLQRHPSILGSIVGYGEVDTEDRYRLWEACRTDFPKSSLIHPD